MSCAWSDRNSVRDEPKALFTIGFAKPSGGAEAGGTDPRVDLGCCRTTRGKDDAGAFLADPAGFDSSEGVLVWIGVNTKFKSAGGKFRSVSLHGGLQPSAGGGVIVLGKYFAGTGEAGISRGEIDAEEKEVAGVHLLGEATKKG